MTFQRLIGWLTRFFVMGHDYEPEPTTGKDGKPLEHADEIAFRNKRHEQIKGLLGDMVRGGKRLPTPSDPHKGELASERVVLAMIAPGRRVPWEAVPLPDGYTLDDLGNDRITYTTDWAVKHIRSLETRWLVMDAKIKLYDIEVAKHKAERDEKKKRAALARSERAFEKAIAVEQKEKK